MSMVRKMTIVRLSSNAVDRIKCGIRPRWNSIYIPMSKCVDSADHPTVVALELLDVKQEQQPEMVASPTRNSGGRTNMRLQLFREMGQVG